MYGTGTTTVLVLLIIGYLTLCTTYTTGVSASEDAIYKTERANLAPAQKNRSAVIEFKAANGKPLTPAEYRAVRLAILRALNRRKHERLYGTTTQEISTIPTSSETLPPQISVTTEPPAPKSVTNDLSTIPDLEIVTERELDPKRRRRDAPILEYYKEDALEFVNMDPEVEGEVFRKARNDTEDDEISVDELFAAIKDANETGELKEAAGGKPVVIYYKFGDLDPMPAGLKLWITIAICLLLLLLLLLLICCLRRKKNRRQKRILPTADFVSVNQIRHSQLQPKSPNSAPPPKYPNGLPSRTQEIDDKDGGSFP